MKQNRFLIPALIAAAAHAALFVIPMPSSGTTMTDPPDDPVLWQPPPLSSDPLVDPPPQDPDPVREPAKPLSGGRQVPSMEELIHPPGPVDFPIPRMEVTKTNRVVDFVPTIIGPADGEGLQGPGSPGGPVLANALDNSPQARVQMRPDYPFEMRRNGVEGSVKVAFVVDTDGRVQGAYVVGSTHREFEAPAVRAVSNWRFDPGRQNGRVVSYRMAVDLVFRLENR